MASWLLTGACLVLAAGSTAALGLLAFAGFSLIPAIADVGHWSPQALRDHDGWADETAASRVGDRRVVAHAVAKAALAVRTAAKPVGAWWHC